METKENIADWTFWNYAENHILAYLKDPTTKYIAMTGSEVTKQFSVPYAHRLKLIELRHTTVLDVAATSLLDLQIRRDAGSFNILPLMADVLLTFTKASDSRITVKLGEGFEYEPTTWTLAFTGISTDRIYPAIYLQRLGRGVTV